MKFYEEKKLDAIASILAVNPGSLQVWSDNSVTVGNNERVEYYATRGTRKHDTLLGHQAGIRVYVRRIE